MNEPWSRRGKRAAAQATARRAAAESSRRATRAATYAARLRTGGGCCRRACFATRLAVSTRSAATTYASACWFSECIWDGSLMLMWTGSRPWPYEGLDRCEVTSGGDAARDRKGDLAREQERTLEHASAHGDEVPIERVARALHQSCSPPSLYGGRSGDGRYR